MSATAVHVQRARLGAGAAAAPGRQALQRWLADIHFARYGLPAQAVLVVRRLQAPLGAFTALADRGADPLALALRAAQRPAQEHFIGAGVAAVWFADEAELLACLARDEVGHELATHWWWPLLLGRAPTPALVLQRWLAAPQALPWALQTLAEMGQAEAWLQQLGPAGRGALVQALAGAYPLCSAVRAAVLGGQASAVDAAAGARPRVAMPAEAGSQSVWRAGAALAADGEGRASPQQATAAHRLLRLAAVLRQAPQRASSPGLVAALCAPLAETVQASALGSVPAPSATRAAAPGSASEGPPAQPHPEAHAVPAPLSVAQGLRGGPQPASPRESAAGATQAWLPAAWKQGHGVTAGGPHDGLGPGPGLGQRSRLEAPLSSQHVSFHTRFGGGLFLLNVALSLGLYGDFTQPQHAGLAVSPWLLLRRVLISARWGGGFTARQDPLTAWLLQRGGPGEARLTAPWQLPAAALQAFSADARAWHAIADGTGLDVWHPAGFCAAHRLPPGALPALWPGGPRAAPAVCLHGARPARTAHRAHRRSAPSRPAPRLSALVAPLLRARLALALGLQARAALALCLPLPARVQAGPQTLNLHFQLADLPLALRLAGLDRDPGWLPAAGCDIRFHFD